MKDGKSPRELASLEAKIRELAKPKPFHTPESVKFVHNLHYDWTGWLSEKELFPETTLKAISDTAPLWQEDGLELREHRVQGDKTQILFKVQPTVSPVLFTQRVKGRLQHALRKAGTPVKFSRKVSCRSLGENTKEIVENYLRKQVRKEGFVDPKHVERMAEFTIDRDEVDLSLPLATNSGRYWYNLHLVLVTEGRFRMANYDFMEKVRDGFLDAGRKKGYAIQTLSVMPDHIHLALRGDIEHSPESIGLSFMNNLSFLLGRNRIWKEECYAGSFSDYEIDLIRKLVRKIKV